MERASIGDWIAAARLRSLAMAMMPVICGASVAWIGSARGTDYDVQAGMCGVIQAPRSVSKQDIAACFATYQIPFFVNAALCLVVAVFIQMAANFANDYSEGKRDLRLSERSGANTDPAFKRFKHLTSSGKTEPGKVLAAALLAAVVAAGAGIALAVIKQDISLIFIGAMCFAAAWFYVGGRHPYGYAGMGELFVFLFFGVVAVFGTVHVLGVTQPMMPAILLTMVVCGCYPCVLLLVNNIRDIERDTARGKRTLAVILGRGIALVLQIIFAVLAYSALVWVLDIFFTAGYPFSVWKILTTVVAVALAAMTVGAIVSTAKAHYRSAYNLSCAAVFSVAVIYVLAVII